MRAVQGLMAAGELREDARFLVTGHRHLPHCSAQLRRSPNAALQFASAWLCCC